LIEANTKPPQQSVGSNKDLRKRYILILEWRTLEVMDGKNGERKNRIELQLYG